MKTRTLVKRVLSAIVGAILILAADGNCAKPGVEAIARRVKPAVLKVLCFDGSGTQVGSGSGFFVDRDGHFVTNVHVLRAGASVRVQTMDGMTYDCTQVMFEDQQRDLAIVAAAIPKHKVKFLRLSRNEPQDGEQVVVIGGPLGLEQTVSEGIVASAAREVEPYGRVIQITAPISPGSSGSPVVTSNGLVVGVATFYQAMGQSLNFAVPTSILRNHMPDDPAAERRRYSEKTAGSIGALAAGVASFQAGNYQQALGELRLAAKQNRRDAEAYYYMGLCYLRLGDSRAAASVLNTAVKINRDYGQAHFGLGVALAELGRYRDARNAFDSAIRAGFNDDEVHYRLGLVLAAMNQNQAAQTECDYLRSRGSPLAHDLQSAIGR